MSTVQATFISWAIQLVEDLLILQIVKILIEATIVKMNEGKRTKSCLGNLVEQPIIDAFSNENVNDPEGKSKKFRGRVGIEMNLS